MRNFVLVCHFWFSLLGKQLNIQMLNDAVCICLDTSNSSHYLEIYFGIYSPLEELHERCDLLMLEFDMEKVKFPLL